ncbi:hypothetical protein [Brevibacillus sp. 179-C9.3 HS]|uniref:hypothetical protein n=1 Tax=unclassified Brevibacillus TaxID=2684853 RepID=UPI0039A2D61D
MFSPNVSVIDTNPASPTFNTEILLIPLSGSGHAGIARTQDGTRAYVTNALSDNVSVIDTNPASPTYNTEIDLIEVSGTFLAGIVIILFPAPPLPLIPTECIHVQKVYDWVILANSYRNKITIADDCKALVDAALLAGQDITFSCIEFLSPDPTCNIVSIRRENITVGGTTVRVGVVRFVFGATVLVRIFADGAFLCDFTATVQFDQEVVLCLPDPLDEDNILCHINSFECSPTGTVLLGGMVQLDVTVCIEIQVEAEVKLEVLAKFCVPRPNNIPIPSPTLSFRCPPILFPPQCPNIFPRGN